MPDDMPPAAGSLPVLIVDDEPAILDLLRSVLEDEGFTVITASNGAAALYLIQRTPIALVLTDLMMPLVSGIDLAHQLHSSPQTASIPLLLMSAAMPQQINPIFAEVFPRIESYPPLVAGLAPMERAPFHLPALDQLLRGGLNSGTTTLLALAPGVGKTTLGLQWALAETQPDAVSLFVSFAEHPEQLARKAAAFGLDLQSAIDRGRVRCSRAQRSPVWL